MIITVSELKKHVDCGNATDDMINSNLESIESVIRAFTHNNFQMRGVRFVGHSEGRCVYGNPQYFTVGDTVQITSQNGVNDGLYTIRQIKPNHIELDKKLTDIETNMVTKIKYPADVVQCAIDLFKWKNKHGDKVGIKSETISRHSVTYEDSSTLFMGYPVGILSGLKTMYNKARC